MKRSRAIRLAERRVTHELCRNLKKTDFVRHLTDKYKRGSNRQLNSFKGINIIVAYCNHSKDLDIDNEEFFENLYWEKEGYFEQNCYKNKGNEFAFQI